MTGEPAIGETGSLLLLCRRNVWGDHAAALAGALFGPRLRVERGDWGDPFPDLRADGGPATILSFLAPWVVPRDVLDRAALALNFHPGSCAYPGIGCYNFALYEEAAEYGCVCHHMAARVDTGAVVAERLFTVRATDTVETLKLRTLVVMLALFHETLDRIAGGERLPCAPRTWSRRPFTRRELDALCRITPDMGPGEIGRRVRATTYPGFPGAVVELAGIRFAAPVPQRPPLA